MFYAVVTETKVYYYVCTEIVKELCACNILTK